jgi:hypothetical protein
MPLDLDKTTPKESGPLGDTVQSFEINSLIALQSILLFL